jgi:glyoxylase-like metal-dependent hydrolase (beta-lactamase superfamily II)
MRARHVVCPLQRIRGLFISNVFVLDGGRGDRWIVDTGHALERPMLLAGLRATGFFPREIDGVLLTHRHTDHAGNAAFLRRAFGLRIYAHHADAEVLDGTTPSPQLVPKSGARLERFFSAIENHTSARVPLDRALDHGDTMGSLEVHHAPGHTDGSVLYRHAATSSLLSGDALLAAVPPLTIVQRMALPHADYSVDVAKALASLRRLHATAPRYENLLAGHGRPILGGAQYIAERLLVDE